MHERKYHYRGFEVIIKSMLIEEPGDPVPRAASVRYRCAVRIRQCDSGFLLDAFTTEYSGMQPFTDESEAVLYGGYAAEWRINSRCAMSARHLDLADAVC
ncbi:hypothetical protein AWB78_08180 [Caballeronia calidae]|uniref:Uncharacterized protein n=1 Tax=Caballeronia calidae TaxID=1777139 RepID=A0A158EJT0_9BURK|nr:hypothetical protein [Caballeronia calidae]SAL06666.1 hypothetical protein AWB78_08180 [Caballeronia calidae]